MSGSTEAAEHTQGIGIMEVAKMAERRIFYNTRHALIGAAFVVSYAMSVSGCHHIQRTYLADGQPGYFIRCGGMSGNWADCLVRAGRLCGPRGYTTTYTDELDRELLVACKSASLDAPSPGDKGD